MATQDDFYDAFFQAVGAPDWHGRNLNALNDSIGTGDINKIEVPYIVRIKCVASMSLEACQMVEDFSELIARLKNEGVEVNLICE
ncbi:MAG: barstar family protein [Pyrinomonadaceae bacterium]